MSERYEELMGRAAKLNEVFQARHVPGTYSVGVTLRPNGDLIMPVYNEFGDRYEDLMMAVGETQVTRCWGKGPDKQELIG